MGSGAEDRAYEKRNDQNKDSGHFWRHLHHF